MTKYFCISSVKSGGKTHTRGQEVALTDSEGKRLLELGVVSLEKVKGDAPAPKQTGIKEESPKTDDKKSADSGDKGKDGDESDKGSQALPYEGLKIADLKKALKKRKLKVGGKIDELRERLREDDKKSNDQGDGGNDDLGKDL